MMQHLPILQVVLPLLAAPLAALLRGRDLAWGLSLLITGTAFLISLALFAEQRALGQTLVYELGGWPAPLGIVYVIDAASALVLPVITGLAFVATIAARQLVAAEIDARDHALFYAAWLLTIAGMLGQVTTGDAFNIFVFLEISSLSAYALVAMGAGRDRRALPAASDAWLCAELRIGVESTDLVSVCTIARAHRGGAVRFQRETFKDARILPDVPLVQGSDVKVFFGIGDGAAFATQER